MASAETNSAVSESPRPGRIADTVLVMGRLHDPAVFECAIAIIARAVEVESRYLKRHRRRRAARGRPASPPRDLRVASGGAQPLRPRLRARARLLAGAPRRQHDVRLPALAPRRRGHRGGEPRHRAVRQPLRPPRRQLAGRPPVRPARPSPALSPRHDAGARLDDRLSRLRRPVAAARLPRRLGRRLLADLRRRGGDHPRPLAGP